MKAARILGVDNIQVVDVPKPKVGPTDVLARVRYVGICGTDLAIIKGELSLVKEGLIRYPITPGHEWAGVVAEVGENVSEFAPGDLVVGDASVGCGACSDCMRGNYHLCKDGYGVGTIRNWDGAYAEYILMPARHMFRIPEGVPLEDAALTEPSATAAHAVERAGVRPGDVVLVEGTGAIGLMAVQHARIAGASLIILSGRNDFKLGVGRTLGADVTINIRHEDLVEKVKRITGGVGVDVVIEASGAVPALLAGIEVTRPGGNIGVVGFFDIRVNEFNIDRLVINEITVSGASGSPNMFPRVLRLMAAGRIACKPLVTHRFPLARINDAMKAMTAENDKKIKILLEVD